MKKAGAKTILIGIKPKLRPTSFKELKEKDPIVTLPVLELNPTQLLASRLVAQGTMTDREIADHCRISRQLLAKWKALPEFMIEIRDKLNQYDKIDRQSRSKVHKDILMPMFAEFQQRISNGDLKDMKITTLKNMIVDISEQLRLDGGEATARTGHDEMEEIQKRFNERSKIESIKTKDGEKKYKKVKVKEFYDKMGLKKVKKSKIRDVSHYFK